MDEEPAEVLPEETREAPGHEAAIEEPTEIPTEMAAQESIASEDKASIALTSSKAGITTAGILGTGFVGELIRRLIPVLRRKKPVVSGKEVIKRSLKLAGLLGLFFGIQRFRKY